VEQPPVPIVYEVGMDLRAGVDDMEKNFLPLPEIEPDFLVAQPVA
jgi:hypothetical protein